MLPKGLRLNNPGNIEKGLPWKGLAEVQQDDRFATFSTPEYGIRAMCKVLLTYNTNYGDSCISRIITRYAPPSENPTAEYIKNVSEWTGFNADDDLDFTDPVTLAKLAEAITRQENAMIPWPDETYLAGAKLALGV